MDKMDEAQKEQGKEGLHVFERRIIGIDHGQVGHILLNRWKFPDIICANQAAVSKGSRPFYSNSTHLPVNYTDDIFRVLDLQDSLQSRYTGGTVLHVFLGEAVADPQAVKTFIRKVCKNYHLPYFTISPTFSVCPEHGYITGEHKKCPNCGTETEVYSRIVGYLRPVKQWNDGKRAEFGMRKRFKLPLPAEYPAEGEAFPSIHEAAGPYLRRSAG